MYHEKHELVTTIPPIHVYINRINNILVFKIKDGMSFGKSKDIRITNPESMKLLGSTKKS